MVLLSLTFYGCSQSGKDAHSYQTPSSTPLSTTSESPSPEQTPVSTPTAEKPSILLGKNYTARVVYVVDGDTIDVLFQDGTKERIRILGIDCPETDADRNRKGE